MNFFSKLIVCGVLGALLGALQPAGAQTAHAPKKRVAADPAAEALNRLLAAAQEAVTQNDYATAAQDYQQYLEKKPDDAAVHFNLGYAYTALHRPSDAQAEYRKAVSLDPKMAPAYLNLGLTLLPSEPGAAVDPLEKAAALLPDQAQPKLYLGAALERSGNLPAAIQQYQAAETLDAKNAEIRLALGRALLAAGSAGDAEQQFRGLLAMSSDAANAAPAHLGLARALIAQKKPGDAAGEFGLYVAARPDDAAAQLERASLLVDLGKYDEALAGLDRPATAAPEGLRALKLRARIFFEQKRYADAVAPLQKAAAIAPRDPDVPALLGHMYLLERNYAAAIESLLAAHAMDPNAVDVIDDLVTAEFRAKNYAAALAALDALAAHGELTAGRWFIRAACYDKLEQPVPALDAYRRFLQMNTDENNDMYFEASARVRVLTVELQNRKKR
jgi:tetratricopeptide (TPR) repeat protein